MLRETGNNISVCTYNGYQEVDRQLHLEEICGRVTVTETVVNVLECDVNLNDRGIGPVVPVGIGTLSHLRITQEENFLLGNV